MKILNLILRCINYKFENIDRRKGRNNIVVSGLIMTNTQEEASNGEMKNFFPERIEIEPQCKNTRKIGAKTYLIELKNATQIMQVMKNKIELRNFAEEVIQIHDDMIREQRNIQINQDHFQKRREKEEECQGRFPKAKYRQRGIQVK